MTTVVVNSLVDAIFPAGGPVSLRNAIVIANASSSPTTITFSPTVFATAETIQMNGNMLELTNQAEATTITAPSVGVTLNGNSSSTVLYVDGGVTTALTNVSITKGSNSGIVNQGTLTLTDATISGNVSPNDGYAGGITNNGTATLLDDTISGNTDSKGGGGNDAGGVRSGHILTMTNVTVTGNTDGYNYGAGGVSIANGTATITNVTVDNNVVNGPFLSGGGFAASAGTTVSIGNSIIAGNTDTDGTAPDVSGSFQSIGYNLVGKTDGSSGFNTADLTGTTAKALSAKLGMLANNGGLTETMLPQPGSPAIGAGQANYVPKGVTTDQRGLPRIVNGKVDIGAVELQPAVTTAITVTAPAAQTATVGVSKSFTLGSFAETNATGPYTATIIWGDGTANTTIKLTATGTIPATAHTYAKTGSDTVSVTVTDSASHSSNKATFAVTVSPVVSTGVISGTVFDDSNGDGKIDDGELGLGAYTVFIDLKGTGTFATGDPTAVTAVNGAFSFTGLAAGTYRVIVESESFAKATTPTILTLTLKAAGTSTGNLFGEKSIA